MGKRLVYNLMCRLMAGISAPEYYDDFITLFEAAFRSIHGRYPARPYWPRLRRARKRIDELTAGVMLAMFLSIFSQTIVATAMPRIIADLGGFDRYTWPASSPRSPGRCWAVSSPTTSPGTGSSC